MDVTVIGEWGGCCRAGGCCSGYLVRSGDTRLLLDCGSGVAGRVQEACPLEELDHVVISHWHADHCGDAGTLLHGRLIQMMVGLVDRPMEFYALDRSPDLERLEHGPHAHAHVIDAGSVLQIGALTCEFMRTCHATDCLATRVRDAAGHALVYTADGALTEELVAFCAGADLVIAECSLYAGVSGEGPGHMNAHDAGELGCRAQPARLVLSHLPIYGDVHELLDAARARWDGPIELARSLTTYEL